ncbi:MAG TPA: hypothetical protein VFI72_01690, partial [Candidatus Angelobacter sp.]|nr:hypothetical protein [Candidatus Angelobacter sp.]
MPKEITAETFEKFVQERRYLYNVSPNTEHIYRNAWAKWQKYGPEPLGFVAGLRQAGTTTTGCNLHIRTLNALFRWAGHPPMRKLKEEDKIPASLSPSDVQKLLKHKPRPNA